MSTNYYLRRKIPTARLKEIKGLVNDEGIYGGKLDEALSKFHEIHIGKSSMGWQFLFNHNDGKYYKKTRDSIDSFLRAEVGKGGKLVNEYGDEMSIDRFWNMVQVHKDGFDLKSYYKYNCDRWRNYQEHPEEYGDNAFKPARPVDFSLDHPETFSLDKWHLRFSDSTEFC